MRPREAENGVSYTPGKQALTKWRSHETRKTAADHVGGAGCGSATAVRRWVVVRSRRLCRRDEEGLYPPNKNSDSTADLRNGLGYVRSSDFRSGCFQYLHGDTHGGPLIGSCFDLSGDLAQGANNLLYTQCLG